MTVDLAADLPDGDVRTVTLTTRALEMADVTVIRSDARPEPVPAGQLPTDERVGEPKSAGTPRSGRS